MKVLVMGDPHFKHNNLHTMDSICESMYSLVDRVRPDLFVCLGDILDTHERVYLDALYRSTKFIKTMADKVPTVVLIGNHDRLNNSDYLTEVSPFYALKEYPNCTIVDTPIWDTTTEFLYVPYVPPGKFLEALAKVGYNPEGGKRPRVIFSHQEFRGGILSVGKVSTKGDVWGSDPDLPLVINGHLHKYHTLPRVINVGTCKQEDYSEDTDKAVILLNFTNPVGDPEITRIPIHGVPIRETIHVTLTELDTFIRRYQNETNKLVRVIVHTKPTDVSGLKKSDMYIQLCRLVDKVQVQPDIQETTEVEKIIKKVGPVDLSLNRVVMELLPEECKSIYLNEICS